MVPAQIAVWAAAYLIGSIPFGLLWGWIFKKIDVRRSGSGRTGGTNVWRTAGFTAALLTALFDGLKGALAVIIARRAGLGPWACALAGTAAVLGHNYSIYLKFRGGAGTGTSVGAAAALWLLGLPILTVAGIAAALLVGHASVGSIVIALMLPILFAARGDVPSMAAFGLPVMALTLWALRPNIKRLLKREERFLPIFEKKPPLIRISRHPAPQAEPRT